MTRGQESDAMGDGVVQQGGSNKMLGGITGKGFMPGQSGNPAGRKKGSGITDRLKRLLDKAEADGRTGYEILAEAAMVAARKGDFRFFKEIYDRMEGKVPDKHEISGPDGDPVEARLATMSDAELRALLEHGEDKGDG